MVPGRLPLSADKDCAVFIKIFLTNAAHYLRYTSVAFIGFYLSSQMHLLSPYNNYFFTENRQFTTRFSGSN